jgi:hypothetical protein
MEGIQCSLKLPGKSENSHLVTLVVFYSNEMQHIEHRNIRESAKFGETGKGVISYLKCNRLHLDYIRISEIMEEYFNLVEICDHFAIKGLTNLLMAISLVVRCL